MAALLRILREMSVAPDVRGGDSAFAHDANQHARFVRRRMPLFAGAWIASSAIWLGLLVVDERFRLTGVFTAFAAQGATLGLMLLARHRAVAIAQAQGLAFGTAAVLGWILLALFAVGTGSRDTLGAMLLNLYYVPAFVFGWGWRYELALQLVTILPAAALLSVLAPSVRPAAVIVAFSLGSAIAIAVAEGTARNLRTARRHRRAAELRTRELLASRDAYRDLAENVEDLIWSFDLEGRWTYLNAAAERFFGRSRAEMIGQSITEVRIPDPTTPPFEEGLARMAAGQPARLVRVHCNTANGPRWIEAHGSGVFAPDGTLVGMRGVSRDITDRVASDILLSESEAKFRLVCETLTTPVFLFQGTHLRYVNAATIAMMDYSEAELLAMPFWNVLHPDERALAQERGLARQRGEQFPPRLDYRVVTKGGEVRSVEFTAVQTEFQGAPAILGTAVDVTERKRAEAALQTSMDELRRSEQRLRRLARHQAQIREDERRRLGFDLHDGVCQELIGVAIMIHSVRERLGLAGRPGAEVLDRAVGYLTTVVEHLRLLARELRPMLLQDLGLADSLTSLAAGMTSEAQHVTVRLATPIPRLEDDVELAVYRIAQEALTNAVRHSDARTIAAMLTCDDGALHLEVRDDGRGFDPVTSDALGLTGMRERAAALGGRLVIDSSAGRGTVITLACPVAERADLSALDDATEKLLAP
jgi:PAS domain S-box-containing protein